VIPWKIILATMVIFACGVVTGGLLTKTLSGGAREAALLAKPPPARGAVLQMQRVLDKQLDLSDEQREQIGRIMKASQARTQPLWDKIAPQMTAEVKQVREEIHDVLTPEQWKKFTDLMKRNRRPNPAPPGDGRLSRSLDALPASTNSL
jgi:Spy/CpxP family protein refolding chaperone